MKNDDGSGTSSSNEHPKIESNTPINAFCILFVSFQKARQVPKSSLILFFANPRKGWGYRSSKEGDVRSVNSVMLVVYIS